MLSRLLKIISQEILFGGHLQALGSVALVWLPALVFQIKFSVWILLAFYLAFYSIYFFDRLLGLKKDTNKYLALHKKRAPFILFISLGLALLLFFRFKLLIFGCLVIILGFLYPLFFKNLTKKIPLFKNIFVALFFASLVFFPFSHFTILAGFLGLLVFLKAILMQIILDLKDEKEDKRNGLLTLPVILGKEKTLTLLKPIIFLVSFFLPLLLSIITNQKFFFYLSSLVFIDLMSWFLVKKNNYQAYFLQASQFLFWLILLLIVKII